jgi:ppGpp synthetase/RelA/SpoT-type nucleotidyltranferase
LQRGNQRLDGKAQTGMEGKMKINRDSIDSKYRAGFADWSHLQDESLFILEHELGKEGIKYHAIHKRIKTLESILEKAERQDNKKPLDVNDIVGLRVVCLFLSDIEKIGNVIRKSFEILSEDNKIEGKDVSSFGYMSVHFVVKLKNSYSGPRYDSVKNIPLEIQVRTIAMDAWAAASHYLDYKSAQDVPSDLRRDFFALSGLFYVADQHFEMFFNSRVRSKKEIAQELKELPRGLDLELNLDSLQQYLLARFPDREHAKPRIVSELLTELKNFKYESIAQIDAVIKKTLTASLKLEKHSPPADQKSKK